MLEVQKSRFLAVVAPAPRDLEAHALLEREKADHPSATHHCYAFLVGPPGSTRCIGYSDAGEPHGAAGRPMFDVLLHSGVGDVACVVTRWFGGKKLGRGGLSRAYGRSVQQALEVVALTEKVEWAHLVLDVAYALLGSVGRILTEAGAERVGSTYGARARLAVRVPSEGRAELEAALRGLGTGLLVLEGDGRSGRSSG